MDTVLDKGIEITFKNIFNVANESVTIHKKTKLTIVVIFPSLFILLNG